MMIYNEYIYSKHKRGHHVRGVLSQVVFFFFFKGAQGIIMISWSMYVSWDSKMSIFQRVCFVVQSFLNQ